MDCSEFVKIKIICDIILYTTIKIYLCMAYVISNLIVLSSNLKVARELVIGAVLNNDQRTTIVIA